MENKDNKFKGPLALIILDGWGDSPHDEGNAIKLAKTPVIDSLTKEYPSTMLNTTGKHVGLPDNQYGNSEAGHLNLGAGRIADQDVLTVTKAIKDKTFFKNLAFTELTDHVIKHDSAVHLLGLVSGKQSAHVQMPHLHALLELLHSKNIQKVYIHLFTDGRDAPQHKALSYIKELKKHFVGNEKIASISGRFYSMDRNKSWDRTEAAYKLFTEGQGFKAENEQEAILQAYNRGETDEFIQPTVIIEDNKPVATIKENDGLIFYNLRSDRARQLAKVFVQKEFCVMNKNCFDRAVEFNNIKFCAMTDFGPDLEGIITAFPSVDFENTLPMVMKDYRQLYISEKEKYAHVTYFFNGGFADPIAGEERIIIPSPDVKSYAQVPEMSIKKLTKIITTRIKKDVDLLVVNYCNPDMIGHTGDLEAGIKAVEICDKMVDKVVKTVLKKNGAILITADHGNVEEMINLETGEVDTGHSGYLVPFILVSKEFKNVKLKEGVLGNVAPTILDIFGVKKPKEMNLDSLIIK
ncbi:2,3-bisphosphoglycerate-independent phosphoglycerate mutase [bacterium]|jgi:2,3-bisphosphoglycerate-independent phosphoglycerate mutase|nr:2,3-bisphosphoglycerate-independent phosphoglycerate mutase [bacterium]MBT4121700.1 2,3-bisphosphoglycerate-independent phosphoglycerate mutase [bacterium]MBT4335072.1 2,3-bisphosphoglycerate-independent phosphoglycerate mutase [bacterium]MBT4495930.1 2,3-bisphosphoglycerate-independent phosphoglycerate mutase [bacterium]MBT4764284.1 2,3-bisphosphoglycerate-independent phosphoglycerate mutase [bacterium]